MEKTEKVMENHGIFCNLKRTNPARVRLSYKIVGTFGVFRHATMVLVISLIQVKKNNIQGESTTLYNYNVA